MSVAYDDALFRAQFPEFADTGAFPEVLVSMFFGVATLWIDAAGNPCRILSGDRLPYALNLMTAHLMMLSKEQSTSSSGAGTEQGGFVTNASVGEVSVGTLAPPAKDGWQWWMAKTPYGQTLWAFLKMLAVGGMSVGGLPERNSFRKAGGVFW